LTCITWPTSAARVIVIGYEETLCEKKLLARGAITGSGKEFKRKHYGREGRKETWYKEKCSEGNIVTNHARDHAL
jgi:hypothetical protein